MCIRDRARTITKGRLESLADNSAISRENTSPLNAYISAVAMTMVTK